MTAGHYFYSSNNYRASEHNGTHLDAPVHFAERKLAADAIPLDHLIGKAVVIDVTEAIATNADYEISIEDVQNWENKNGKLPDDCIILFRTGVGKYYPDAQKYLGTMLKRKRGIDQLHFPGISPNLSQWLIENRKIKAVGLDTPSVDFGQSKTFMTHRILYEQDISGFENVTHLDMLPPMGAFVFAMPMKIKDGSGAPLRMIAWVPN